MVQIFLNRFHVSSNSHISKMILKCFCLISLTLCLSSFVHSLNNSAGEVLDAYLQDSAFQALVRPRPHTGNLYTAILPANLSGMEVSVVRLRSRRLWNMGANFSNIQIPSRSLPVPHVKRLAIVYENLGNCSSHYYSVPGYALVTSVVGLQAFDASNVSEKAIRNIDIHTTGKPILISFRGMLVLPDNGMDSGAKCVRFCNNGTVYFSDLKWPSLCYASGEGHFSVAVRARKERAWFLWVIGFVLGFILLILGVYGWMVFIRVLKSKRIQAMERQSDEGVIFYSRWVGDSKMPFATLTRTQPVLENGRLS